MPTVQPRSPEAPASRAADRIRAFARSVSAEQASNRAPSLSITKRKVNGVITGRGAEMSLFRAIEAGLRRARSASIRAFSAALSVMAVTAILPGSTEIFERGSVSSVTIPKSSAACQFFGSS